MMATTRRRHERGQSLVEFSLALIVFLMLLMGVFDFGRGIYMYNGVAQAARELARVTSVHPGATLGGSSQTAAVLATQQNLIPGLGTPTYSCVDIAGSAVTGSCLPDNFVEVRIVAPYAPITPLLGLVGTFNLQSTSTVAIQSYP
jgi:Flp pilus assembly protein TadG